MNSLKWNSLEEICHEIGYTATMALVTWFGGGQLWVPRSLDQSHAIAKVCGLPAAQRLSKIFPGKRIDVPVGHQDSIDRRDKMIAVMVWSGLNVHKVAVIVAMSDKQIYNILERVDALGVKPMLLKRAGLESSVDSPSATPGCKSAPKTKR